MLRDEVRNEVVAWFERARRDLRAAAVDMGAQPPLSGDAAFHCQQAAEKAVKGLLVARGIPFPKTHDIRALADLVETEDPDLDALLDRAAELTEYAWRFRYPGEVFDPADDEIADAMAVAAEVVEVLEALSLTPEP
jgi:HEPN domain-containing protein